MPLHLATALDAEAATIVTFDPRLWDARQLARIVRRAEHVMSPRKNAPVKDVWTISGQFFAEQHEIPGPHPSYRHEEPAYPNTCVTL